MYEKIMREHGWCLQCTVNVKCTADSTYFCVVGWGPGGYSGIKQVDSNQRLAVFSMWNDEETYSTVRVIWINNYRCIYTPHIIPFNIPILTGKYLHSYSR